MSYNAGIVNSQWGSMGTANAARKSETEQKNGQDLSERTENSSIQCVPHPISEATAAKVSDLRPRQWRDLPTLVVGVWQPGIPDKVVTLAFSPHDPAAFNQNTIDPNYRPDIVGDIMKIPNEDIGQKKYRMIVFQGVCPVATAMGGKPCRANEDFEKVDPEHLAWKLKGLISEEGGFIFFRHCCYSANIDGIADQDQRQHFINSLQKMDIKLLIPNDLRPPRLVTQHAPDSTIPDPDPGDADKWNSENGAMVFFSPSYKV
jgi:hypothetical protein